MMTEKDMVNDYLSSLKSSLTGYASAISESSNPELRKTFQQMRDADEQRQQKLAQFAIQKDIISLLPRLSKARYSRCIPNCRAVASSRNRECSSVCRLIRACVCEQITEHAI